MKADAFRDLSREELDERIGDLREQMLKLRFQKSTGQIENPQTLAAIRRDLARALTVRREIEIQRGGEAAAEPAAAAAGVGASD